MAEYYLVRYQQGGCDYTIGCGTTIEKLPAETFEEAQEMVIRDHRSTVSLPEEKDWDRHIDDCYILVVDKNVNMMNSLLDAKHKMKLTKRKEQEQKDKEARHQEYEKLKKEFDVL